VLLGREHERAAIEGLVEDARSGRSRALVIRGEAGIGKSALLGYAFECAEEMRVLHARGIESEAELAFSGLLELSRPVLDRLEELPARQALALRTAFALEAATAVDRFAISAATLGLIGTAAEKTPLLIAVDDAHWLDSASLDALVFTARRLEADEVAFVFAVREGEGAFPAGVFEELVLEGLDAKAATKLLESASPARVDPGVAQELYALTRGNPLALVELPRALSPAQLAGSEPLDDPLHVGTRVERLFARRAAALGERSRHALIVAAASNSEEIEPTAKALTLLSLDLAELDAAEAADLIRFDRHRLAFRHPLVRAGVYHSAAPSERRAAHAALAEALTGQARYAEQRAWHLASAALGPDEQVAAALERAAAAALRRSGYAAAAAAYERAARLTAEGPDRLRRVYQAADAAWLAGRTTRARQLLDEALDACQEQRLRGELLALRGHIEHHSGDQKTAYKLLVEAASLLETRAHTDAVASLIDAFECCLWSLDFTGGLQVARRLHALARPGDGTEGFLASLALGYALLSTRAAGEGLPLLEHALELADTRELVQKMPRFLGWIAVPWWLDRSEAGRRMASDVVDLAREQNAVGVLPEGLTFLAMYAMFEGRWSTAYAACSEGAILARELGQLVQLSHCLWRFAWIEAARGEEQACRAHVGELNELNQELDMAWNRFRADRALALLDFSLGHFETAVAQLEALVDALETRTRWPDPDEFVLADLVEGYVRGGRRNEAAEAFTSLERFANAVPRPWLLALADRCRGLLATDGEFVPHFIDALTRHEEAENPFEHARTRLCFGERLRRAGQRKNARDHLRAALTVFEQLGAAPWARRARSELRASGETLRRRDAGAAEQLTPQELQIALQVAEGKTNREVGAALFLSPKTIEFHLSRAYRKLGVRSRAELIRRFAETNSDPAAPRSNPQTVDPSPATGVRH
jgi:DNA-binding CsgD family transcriptional regulator